MGRKEIGYFVDKDKYYCWYCDEIKSINDFTKDKNNPKGFKSRCKKCFNEYVKNWRGKNKESYKKYITDYKKKKYGK
jgi:hypothetical protein